MALLGSLIARSLKLRQKFTPPTAPARVYQRRVLRQLLERGQYTRFGKHYGFGEILSQEVDYVRAYQKSVPIHDYDRMHREWWHMALEGIENVSWPGKVKYFALSSGTSGASSKHIPVTKDMLRSVKRMGLRQLYSLVNFDVPGVAFQKGVLMLGGTTSLFEKDGYYEGDMSGISAKNMPQWMSRLLYKPGQKISKTPHWEDRIKAIVRKARKWDVGTVCGVPAWVQIVLERIIAYHKVETIHDIWPNLSIYIHGGVSFEPYRDNFQKLLGKPIAFIETYMASEGSFGFQARPGEPGIKLVLNNGIFFEFIPFIKENFNDDGVCIDFPKTYMIDEVKEGVDYAVLLSTPSGAWRYLIGDVVRFSNAKEGEIMIVGRTKQFLSICGEHTSIDNLNEAVARVQRELGITVREFTVSGYAIDGGFAHRWALGCDDHCAAASEVKRIIDETLQEANDDYAVERASALKEVFVDIYPNDIFYDYLRAMGKEGAMNKFPRVLKGKQLEDWNNWLSKSGIKPVASA
jgi:hypothetical protein